MKKIDLTKGKVLSVLAKLSIPIMVSSLLQFTYSLVDMLWVGNLGSKAVASIGSSSFYTGLGYSINALVVIGTGTKVAHAIGNKDDDNVHKYINSGLFINLIIGLVYGLILIFAGKSFISFLNIKDLEVAKDSYTYLAINAPILFLNFYNILYSRIMGSFGDNSTPLKISAIGIIINIILDPILIYVFDFGVEGAAIATLISNIIMFILYRTKTKGTFRYNKKLGIDMSCIKEIVAIGLPMSFQRVLFTIINILLARIIGSFGENAIAAQKIGLQIESITYMIIGGLHGAISSFTGQNYGAKKYSRIREGYKTSLFLGIGYSMIMSFIFFFWNEPIIRFFVNEKETIIIAGAYLRVVAYSQIFSTMETMSNGLFTGLGLSKIPAIISIVFTALRIPMAIIFSQYLGVSGVWISIALSSVLKGVIALLVCCIKLRKENKYVKCIEE